MKKEYNIDTIQKFLNVVNEDNFYRVFIDFAEYVGIYLQIVKSERSKSELNKDKLNSELVGFKSFRWIDDGKCGIRTLEIHNPDTGEILTVKNKRKRKVIK